MSRMAIIDPPRTINLGYFSVFWAKFKLKIACFGLKLNQIRKKCLGKGGMRNRTSTELREFIGTTLIKHIHLFADLAAAIRFKPRLFTQ